MRKQQYIWEKEHYNSSNLPCLAGKDPSSAVIEFVEYLKLNKKNHDNSKIIDMGCGKGRNAIYLAKLGFTVYGIDYSKNALKCAIVDSEKNNLSNLTKWYQISLDDSWPFEDNYFDFAVDCFSTIDIETKIGRENAKNEMFRTLKNGGYALVTVVSIDDEIENEMIKKYPGSEKNSTYWYGCGKFQKNYDKKELELFYKNFEIIVLKKIFKPSFKLNRYYNATNFWLLIKKPFI